MLKIKDMKAAAVKRMSREWIFESSFPSVLE
jgi:hypothetical protein